MATTIVGKIVLMPKGNYNASTTYQPLDWVRYDGASWVCKYPNTVGITPVEGDNWSCIAQNGRDGIDGQDGADGVDGQDGADGTDGKDGSIWLAGNDLSGTGTGITGVAGNENDLYLNTITNNVYQCVSSGTSSTATWNYLCNIKGASGSGSGDMESDTYAPTAKSQGLSNVVDSALSLNGLTASVTELNYMDGVTSNVQTQLNGKVSTEIGKGLSSNDYTTAEKNKLSGIDAGAEVNVIDEVSSEFSVTNKTLSLASSVTSKLSYVDTNGSIQDALDLKADTSDLNSKADTTDLDEWTSEATATTSGTDTVVTFTGLNDSLAYDIYCDAINTSAEVKSKTGSGTNVTLVYKLTGSNVLVGTTKAKLRIVK